MPLVPNQPKVPSFDELREKKQHVVEKSDLTVDAPLKNDNIVINIRPVGEVMQEAPVHINHMDFGDDTKITARIFGAGGCGKVAAIRYSKVNNFNKKITVVDTSGLTEDIPGVEVIRIPGLNGSGKYRRENIAPITNFIVKYTGETEFAPVNIILMSLSGGSGSVIGPLLVKEIFRQKKIAIVLGVIDTDSEIDTINAFNTVKTLDSMAADYKGYLPVVLFDNNKGRTVVDNAIDLIMENISILLDIPYIGLDAQDRVKFLNPNVFDGVSGGVRLMNISKRPDFEWEDESIIRPPEDDDKIDATIIITKIGRDLGLNTRCVATFRGYYADQGNDVVASIGYPIPADLITFLNNQVNSFKDSNVKKSTLVESEKRIGEKESSGLIL